jgi:hypothetical protein
MPNFILAGRLLRASNGLTRCGQILRNFPRNSALSLPMVAGPFMVMNSDARHRREFQLRTLWVVTLCSLRPTIALLRRGGRPTMRYDATGCPLRAETLLAALFEASSPIHEDRNGMPQPAAAIL